jgi:hypothetical protein
MAVYSRILLSGSTSGTPIPVAATATPGTLIHTAIAGATAFDEVYIWASNVTSGAATLTIEWGGTSDPGSHFVKAYSIAANSPPMPIAVGQCVNGGVAVRAFSSAAGAINVTGFVNRIQ